jgi:hypothetical protein
MNTNGHVGEQIRVQETLQADPCANCGALTQKVIAFYVFNPSAPGLLRAVSTDSNQMQAQLDMKARDAYSLCFNCLRTEYWTVNPENPKEWNKLVTAAGREPTTILEDN